MDTNIVIVLVASVYLPIIAAVLITCKGYHYPSEEECGENDRQCRGEGKRDY